MARRLCGLQMLTAKNSKKRIEACSPVVAASVGRAVEVMGDELVQGYRSL